MCIRDRSNILYIYWVRPPCSNSRWPTLSESSNVYDTSPVTQGGGVCGLCGYSITRVGCRHIKNGNESLQAVKVRVGENIRQPAGIENTGGVIIY